MGLRGIVMIKNEKEYKNTLEKIKQGEEAIKKQRVVLKENKLTNDEIKRALEPMLVIQEELLVEIGWYEKIF